MFLFSATDESDKQLSAPWASAIGYLLVTWCCIRLWGEWEGQKYGDPTQSNGASWKSTILTTHLSRRLVKKDFLIGEWQKWKEIAYKWLLRMEIVHKWRH